MIDLSPDDQVSLAIGRAARQAVELELALQRSHKELTSTPYEQRGLAGVNDLVEACVSALHSSPLPAELREHAVDALSAALTANRRRNRAVHDLWRPTSDPDVYEAIKFDGGDGELKIAQLAVTDFAEIVKDLKIARERVVAIYFLIAADRSSATWGNPMRETQERLIRGDFRINPEGNPEWNL